MECTQSAEAKKFSIPHRSKSEPLGLNLPSFENHEGRASTKLPFLLKLHEMLDDVEKTGNDHIVSWLPHGKAFRVHKPKAFVQKIVPQYFKQSKYKSFQRQLYIYGFVRTPRGPEAGAYSHPDFLRGMESICLSMSPKNFKVTMDSRSRRSLAPATFKDFVSSGPLIDLDPAYWKGKIKRMLKAGALLANKLEERMSPHEEKAVQASNAASSYDGLYYFR